MDGATLHEPSGKLGRGPFVAPLVVIPATLAIALAYGYADVYCPMFLISKTSTQKADLSPRYVVDPATYERLAALHGKPPAPPPAPA